MQEISAATSRKSHVRHSWCPDRDANLQSTQWPKRMNWVAKKLSDLAPFWVTNECVKVWQRTRFFWLILGLSVRASLTDTSKPPKQKELLTFPTKKHNLHPSNIFTNLTPYSALTVLSETSQTQLGRKALKTKSLFVLGWRHKQTEEIVYVDSLKRSQKSNGVEKKEKRPVYLMFCFFPLGTRCAGNPFICHSLTPHSSF